MATFEVIAHGLDRLAEHFQRIGPAVLEAQKRTVNRAALLTQSKIIARAKSELRVRSGGYSAGAEKGFAPATVTPSGVEARAGIADGPAAKYAAVQEFGAVITPKQAKVLAVPVGEALTGAGVPRYASPLDVPGDAMWITPKGRKPLFVTKDENDEIDQVLFVGLDHVTVTGKHIVERSTDEVAPLVPQIGSEELDRAIAAAIGG